jgi:RimJ/RimL family protein N-acetyltransferase
MGYWEVSQDENIHKYTGNSVPECVGETAALLAKYEKFFFNWMILSNETHAVIGIIRLGKPEMENGMLVAGESQFLSSKYWRKGHMKEAKKLFYQYVFHVLSIDVLYADVWDGNINSIKSLESYGYHLVETRTALFPKTGASSLKYVYSLTKQDYQRSLKKETV